MSELVDYQSVSDCLFLILDMRENFRKVAHDFDRQLIVDVPHPSLYIKRYGNKNETS